MTKDDELAAMAWWNALDWLARSALKREHTLRSAAEITAFWLRQRAGR